jgi:hypothetical protein
MNINLQDVTNPEVQIYKSIVNANGYFFLNNSNFPTRISNTISTTIDHIATNIINNTYRLATLDTSLSDHQLLLLSVNRSIPRRESSIFKTFMDYDRIIDLGLLNNIGQQTNIEEFMMALTRIIQNNTTIKRFSVKTTPKKKYITHDIMMTINQKEKIFRLSKRFPENEFFRNYYRILRNLVKYKIRISKKKYYEESFQNVMDDGKKTWEIINDLISGKKKKKFEFALLINGEKITDEAEVAEAFNKFFVEVSKKIHDQIEDPVGDIKESLNYCDETIARFEDTTEAEVMAIIDNLNQNVAVGYDAISSKFLKKFKMHLCAPITAFINRSLQQGVFPDCLKIAKVTPIYKSGKKSDINNYRPISVLTSTSKIFETIILKRMLNHLNKTEFFHQNQYGFLPSSNTLAAAINLMNFIFTKIDKKERVGCLFIDLQKAFDCVHHSVLIEKLKAAGFTGEALALFKSYLTNRGQFVQINGKSSSKRTILAGIAQGSILGATLFLVFINDIFNIPLLGKIQLYADDAVLMYATRDHQTVICQMKSDLKTLDNWFGLNYIKMNVLKTNFILFKGDEQTELTINFAETTITEAKSTKFLGLKIDKHLKWDEHLNQVRKRILPMIFALKRTRYCISEKVAFQL